MRRTLTVTLALLFVVSAAPCQEAQPPGAMESAEEQTRPQGWRVLTDQVEADTSEIDFATMEPGFHVTTGPAAIFYHPDSTASAPFRAQVETHLFDPGDRNEAFGIFFGGSDLDGSYQAYTYFLVRKSGEYLVKRRMGESTETIEGWTAHPAVVGWDERDPDAESVRNVLAVDATADELIFSVNDEEVTRVPRSSQLAVDGIVGVRINHALDVHLGGLRITQE